MKFKQISIMGLLLVTALVAVTVGYILERRTSQRLVEQTNRLKSDVGFIEIESPSLVHVRKLHSEDASWEYRVYLPPDHGLAFELSLGDPDDPEVHTFLGDPQEGQFNLTIYRYDSYAKPNRIEKQIFVIGCVGNHSDPDSITRHGESWLRSQTQKYQQPSGSYENKIHQISLKHDLEVKTYRVDEEIPFLLVWDQSEAGKDVPEEQRDRISIKLKPRE